MPKSEPIGHLRLTSTTKAAEYLNTTDGHIRQLIAEGRIKGYRVGRLIKVDANEIAAFIVPIDNTDSVRDMAVAKRDEALRQMEVARNELGSLESENA